MPTNQQTDSCISTEAGILVFWAPPPSLRRRSTKVQIIDVFSLQVVTGFTRDSSGKLLLESQPSIAAGRSWTLAKATQLIRNDARPTQWVALEMNKHAWGLFWAGGGLQRCREILTEGVVQTAACSAIVPATPEALLRLVLDLGPEANDVPRSKSWHLGRTPASSLYSTGINPWSLIAMTSLVWMAVLGFTILSFLDILERQDRKLELLLRQTTSQRDNAK